MERFKSISIDDRPELPSGVLKAYKDKKLVIFVGAGISRLMGCMGWEQMANTLVSKMCSPASADQIINSSLDSKAKITIARRYAAKQYRDDEFWDFFTEAIQPDDKSDDIYKTITKLTGTFITTNCDGLLTKHFPNAYTTKCTTESFLENEGDDYVFCIHGNYGKGTDEDKESLVFTVEQYLKNYAKDAPLVSFLGKVMRDRTVLFLGYGLNEFEIISKAFLKDDEIETKHYILEGFFEYQQELAEAQAEYYKSLGVKLIAYSKDKNGYGQQREIIENWVNELYEKTPYASRNLVKVESFLKKNTKENRAAIKRIIARDDDMGRTGLKAVLEAIPASKDSFSWLSFIIGSGFLKHDHLKKIARYPQDMYDIIYSGLNCAVACIAVGEVSEAEYDTVRQFVYDCVYNAVEEVKEPYSYRRLSLFIEAIICYDLMGDACSQTLWKSFISVEPDVGFYLLKDRLSYIKTWPDILQSEIMKMLFTAPEKGRDDSAYYWYDRAAKIIAESLKKYAIVNIVKYCADQTNDFRDSKAFMHSLDDRFQLSTSGYDGSIYHAMETMIEPLHLDKQSKLCDYMIQNACSVFGYQVALHFAAKYEFANLNAFRENPLLTPSTFVEFYYWLEKIAGKLNCDDADLIYRWIEEADFGYKSSGDEGRNRTVLKRISTYKYQLQDILAHKDEKYMTLRDKHLDKADLNKKTPSEDKEEYYSVRMGSDDVALPVEIATCTDFAEMHSKIKSVAANSGWHSDSYVYGRIYKELFNTINDKQLRGYSGYVLDLPDEEAVLLIRELISTENLKRCNETLIRKLIRKLRESASDTDSDNELRTQMCSMLVNVISLLKQCGWTDKKIFSLSKSIEVDSVFPEISAIEEDLDLPTNILNISECILFSTVIKSASNCRDDMVVVKEFKKWYKKQVRSSRETLFLLTCAYWYSYLLFMDSEWAHGEVLNLFKEKDYRYKLALCLCCGMPYVSEEEATFVTEEDSFERVLSLIDEGGEKYIEDSRYITYIIAAHYFGYISQSTYEHFLDIAADKHIEGVFDSITSGIRDEGDTGKKRLLIRTYNYVYPKMMQKASYEIINSIWRFDTVDSACWGLIAEAMESVLIDDRIWILIDQCMRKTIHNNKHIAQAFTILLSKVASLDGVSLYHFDNILYRLARIKSYGVVAKLAELAVKSEYRPLKYSKYVDRPEQALTDFKNSE